jgi:hypothetical protein
MTARSRISCQPRLIERLEPRGGGKGLILLIWKTEAEQGDIRIQSSGYSRDTRRRSSRGRIAVLSLLPPEEIFPRGRSWSG